MKICASSWRDYGKQTSIFENKEVDTKVCASVEDKKALEFMEGTLQKVNGHFQVALPWRYGQP